MSRRRLPAAAHATTSGSKRRIRPAAAGAGAASPTVNLSRALGLWHTCLLLALCLDLSSAAPAAAAAAAAAAGAAGAGEAAAAAGAEEAAALAGAAVPTQGSFFEQHMAERLGVSEHGELPRRLHEAAAKAQADAEAVRDSGEGTSEYLAWRRQLAVDHHPRYNDPKHPKYIDKYKRYDGRGRLLTQEEHPLEQYDERGRRLEVLTGNSGTASLIAPALNTPPSPADINITCIRHGSVTPPAFVDWRASQTVNTPVFDQKACESCWLWAAADIISMKWALLSRFLYPVPLSPQHVCDCGYAKKCCGGGWPEWTFLFAKSNKGVALLDAYPYLAKDNQACRTVNSSLLTGKITGWEKLPASNPVTLIKTISMHPAVVLIQTTASFMSYSGGIWQGLDCPARATVNHALVVMGYNATSSPPYWIAKNSWGTGWGEGGYIRIAMVSNICGFGRMPSLYPTMFRVRTPCDGVAPCGTGTCYLTPAGDARCLCPTGFVEKLEAHAPKCLTATPCTGAMNPCSFGSCNNEFDGTYTCSCPAGTVVGTRADGAETCIVNTFQSGLLTTKTIPGDTCYSIAFSYNITVSTLVTMNPFLNCSAPLTSGVVIVVGGMEKGVGCATMDVVGPGDTCKSIAARNNIETYLLTLINPGLDCTGLLLSQHLCVEPGQLAPSSPYERSCGRTYTTEFDDSCLSVAVNNSLSLTLLQWLNPGLDCTAFTLGQTTVCVSPLAFQSVFLSCDKFYNVTQGDECWMVARNIGLTLEQFLAINPGVRCNPPFWAVGVTVCISGTAIDPATASAPPNMMPVYVRRNDTILSIATTYSDTCALSNGSDATPESLALDMCWANGWYPNCNDRSIVPGSVVLVPCAPRIGGSTCVATTATMSNTGAMWCGSNFVTYLDNSCASTAFAGNSVFSRGPCAGCTWMCTGLAGIAPVNFWGTLAVPGCNMAATCPLPKPVDSSWSALCPTKCSYALVQCSSSTFALGASAVGCTGFQRCVAAVMNMNVTQLVASTCQPDSTGIACARKYDMAMCSGVVKW